MASISEVREIPLKDLEIGKGQVRVRGVGKDIDELADSIRKVGLLEPIVVCEGSAPGRYEIITGQRRFLAHQELRKETILAAILDRPVDELEAKVLSVTENLVRRDLNSRDLIDVCTELYRRYGSVSAVAEETGLPRREVNKYVKFERLIPELKELVSSENISIATALRAQDAASVSGDTNAEEAIELAKEMEPMSGAQQDKIVKDRASDPDAPVDEVIEHAKTGGKITQVLVKLTSTTHRSLRSFADIQGTSVGDAARDLIESALADQGLLDE